MATTTGKVPPMAPGAVPVLGHIPLVLRSRFDFIDAARVAGPVCRVRVGPATAYFVNDHDLLVQILLSDAHDFVRGVQFKKMRSMFGDGIVTTSGDLHRRQRRTMLPSFTQRRLALHLPVMRRIMARFVASIPPNEPYDLMGPSTSLGCEIVAATLFGEECPPEILDLVSEAIPVFGDNAGMQTLDVTGVYRYLPTSANRKFRRMLADFDRYIYSVIDRRMRSGAGDEDLLDVLINTTDAETKRKFTRTEVRDQALTILLAATETTANTISWACYELARHPRVFAACRAEVDALADGRDWDEIEVGRSDLGTIRRVLFEALRMYPSSYLLSRQAARDTTLGGYAIPGGAILLYSHYGLHRDERLFSHADEFDPDRWLETNQSEVTTAAFMPFGHGAYRCLGENLAVIESTYCLAMMAGRWNFTLDDHCTPHMKATLALSPEDLRFVFSKR
ncbi:Pentalenene oxygenase [Frankia sp. Hr75.2]|nr:cytochrome P450 [Parafrankia sp. BMG5.11]CAI7974095.1 Pentalenene oxygenase [Frankia sp. Hr75.2]SQE00588.1 Pentalenene oxygenase [Parafrankia sp. Ea1.12]